MVFMPSLKMLKLRFKKVKKRSDDAVDVYRHPFPPIKFESEGGMHAVTYVCTMLSDFFSSSLIIII